MENKAENNGKKSVYKIVIDQITVGDVVDVKFLKSKKLLTDLMISPDVWVYTGVKDYAIDTLTKNISIKDSMRLPNYWQNRGITFSL